MKKMGILAIITFLVIGCGGGSSSNQTPQESNEELNNQEVKVNKLLNEEILGRWHVYMYDTNNRISQQLYYYDFREDGEVLYGSPVVDKEYVLKWMIESQKVKIIFSDFNLTLEPIDYYSEANRIINMREVSSSGNTNLYAWDKIGN